MSQMMNVMCRMLQEIDYFSLHIRNPKGRELGKCRFYSNEYISEKGKREGNE